MPRQTSRRRRHSSSGPDRRGPGTARVGGPCSRRPQPPPIRRRPLHLVELGSAELDDLNETHGAPLPSARGGIVGRVALPGVGRPPRPERLGSPVPPSSVPARVASPRPGGDARPQSVSAACAVPLTVPMRDGADRPCAALRPGRHRWRVGLRNGVHAGISAEPNNLSRPRTPGVGESQHQADDGRPRRPYHPFQ